MKSIYILVLAIFTTLSYGQEIPNLTIKDIDGETTTTEKLLEGDNVKIISFWATWCVPCINELDAIEEVYEDWQDETGVEVIAVATDDARTKKRVQPLVNGKDWSYKILMDENQDFKRALNINVLPYVVVIKDGEIIHTRTGYTPGSEEELYEIVKEHSK